MWLVESRRQNVAGRGGWRVKERIWLVERRRRYVDIVKRKRRDVVSGEMWFLES